MSLKQVSDEYYQLEQHFKNEIERSKKQVFEKKAAYYN
jgi:hypothetical protein